MTLMLRTTDVEPSPFLYLLWDHTGIEEGSFRWTEMEYCKFCSIKQLEEEED